MLKLIIVYHTGSEYTRHEVNILVEHESIESFYHMFWDECEAAYDEGIYRFTLYCYEFNVHDFISMNMKTGKLEKICPKVYTLDYWLTQYDKKWGK